MAEAGKFSSLIKQAVDMLPDSADRIRQDIEDAIKPVVTKKLSELNVVTREEFDQQIVLIERLEAQVTQLEERLEKALEMLDQQKD